MDADKNKSAHRNRRKRTLGLLDEEFLVHDGNVTIENIMRICKTSIFTRGEQTTGIFLK